MLHTPQLHFCQCILHRMHTPASLLQVSTCLRCINSSFVHVQGPTPIRPTHPAQHHLANACLLHQKCTSPAPPAHVSCSHFLFCILHRVRLIAKATDLCIFAYCTKARFVDSTAGAGVTEECRTIFYCLQWNTKYMLDLRKFDKPHKGKVPLRQ